MSKTTAAIKTAVAILRSQRHFTMSDARERISVALSEARSPEEAFADPVVGPALTEAANALARSRSITLAEAQGRMTFRSRRRF